MRPFAATQELQFREEATKRTLQDFYDAKDLDGLMKAAVLLNAMWHQQTAIARWFAHEAAENLSETWALSARR